MKKTLIAVVLVLVLGMVGVVLYVRGTMYPLEIATSFFFGWAQFLIRVIPDMNLTFAGSLATVVWLALILVGLHRFCGWLFCYNQKTSVIGVEHTSRQWR